MDALVSTFGWDLLCRMVFGFAAAVAGIALWSHSREPAWILVVAATLLAYVEVILQFLHVLGVINLDQVLWQGLPWARMALAGGVPLLYGLGLVAAFRALRRP